MRVSEIRVKRIRVNQGVGVYFNLNLLQILKKDPKKPKSQSCTKYTFVM